MLETPLQPPVPTDTFSVFVPVATAQSQFIRSEVLIAAITSEEIGDGEETVTEVAYVPPGPEIEAKT